MTTVTDIMRACLRSCLRCDEQDQLVADINAVIADIDAIFDRMHDVVERSHDLPHLTTSHDLAQGPAEVPHDEQDQYEYEYVVEQLRQVMSGLDEVATFDEYRGAP